MADHTIVNLEQVDDAAARFGVPAGLEARFARRALALDKSGVTLFDLAPGYRIPWGHRHRDQEEVYLVVRGTATVRFEDGDTAELSPWSAVRIPAAVARSFEAGPEGARLVAFGAGEQGDTEMIQDFWR